MATKTINICDFCNAEIPRNSIAQIEIWAKSGQRFTITVSGARPGDNQHSKDQNSLNFCNTNCLDFFIAQIRSQMSPAVLTKLEEAQDH